jgi:PAS domain S-box-containing protein
MGKKTKDTHRIMGIRKLVEKQLKKQIKSNKDLTLPDAKKILHELNVYQIELEMQNDELRKTQTELIEANENYLDMFNFAPVAYLRLSDNGIINEVNLTAVNLFGIQKSLLIKKPLSRFIVKDDQDIYSLHLKNLIATRTKQQFDIRMKGKDRSVFWANIISVLIEKTDGVLINRVTITDITERKNAEEALRMSEEKHSATLSTLYSIGDGIIVTDNHGIIKQMNPVAEGLTGCMEADSINKPLEAVFKIINELTRKKIENPVHKVLSEGIISGLTDQTLLISKSGFEISIADCAAPIKSKNGKIFGVVLVFKDQTEERTAQKAIAESRRRFLSLFTNMNEGVGLHELVMDKGNHPVNYRIIDANPQFEKILGMNRREIAGKLATEIYKTSQAPYLEIYSNVAVTSMPYKFETYFDSMDKHFLISVVPWLNDGFATIFTDITERKIAEEALRESESRLKRAELASKSGNWELHIDTQIMFASEGAEKIYGSGNSPFEYRTFKSHPLSEYRPLLDSALKNLIENNQPYDLEYKIKTTDTHEIKVIHSVAELIRDEKGKTIKVRGVLQDITGLKRFEDEQKANLEILRIVNRIGSKEDFIHSVITYLKDWLKCDAVGIRLKDGIDFPYFETYGFSEKFVRKEKYLCDYNKRGEAARDSTGNPVLECMCGNIICGRFDPSKTFFTKHGSFWSNSTTELLANTTDEDRQARTRNRCNGEGYESVGLFPLRLGSEVFGLIQVNHKQKGLFTRELLSILERLANNIAIALSNHLTRESLILSEQKYRSIYENALSGIFRSTSQGRFLSLNPASVKMFGYASEEEIINTITDIGKQVYANKEERSKIIAEIGRSGFIENYELECLRKDGKSVWLLINMHLVRGNEDTVQHYEGTILDITERKRAEEALRQSEERYRQIYENSSLGIYRTTPDGQILLANPALLKMLHYSSFEEIASRDLEISGMEPVYDRKQFIKQIETDGEVKGFESAWVSNHGTIVYVRENARAVMDLNGKTLYYDGMVEDITERKLAREEALESEGRFEAVYNASPSAISISEIETGKLFEINEAYEKLLGYSKEEAIGKSSYELGLWMSENDRKIITDNILNKGFYNNTETRLKTKNNSIITCLISGRIVYIKNRKLMIAILHDITDLQNAAIAIKESEERFRKLFEEHSAVKLLIDFNTGKIVDANNAATKYYGWDKEELLRMNINELNTLPAKEIQKEMETAKDKTKSHFEFQHRLKNGMIRYVDVFSSKVIIGNKEYLHSIIHDITDRKFAEIELEVYRDKLEDLVKERTKELNHANEELQQMIEKEKEIEVLLQKSLEKEKVLNEMKTNFISMASHEFRTPLTTILSSTDLLAKYYKRWEENKIISHYKKIQSSVHYMIAMLDEVLIISRSDRGKIGFNPSELNLKEFSADIIEQLKSQALPTHNIIFDYKLSYQNVLADPKLLNHILNNLLTNALKFSPEGGDIALSVEDENEFIKFTINDNGIGIPKEDIHNLFEPFFRAQNSSGIKGTGLGLSIVKRYLELHNGIISLESQPGKGTKFFVKIRKETKNR